MGRGDSSTWPVVITFTLIMVGVLYLIAAATFEVASVRFTNKLDELTLEEPMTATATKELLRSLEKYIKENSIIATTTPEVSIATDEHDTQFQLVKCEEDLSYVAGQRNNANNQVQTLEKALELCNYEKQNLGIIYECNLL